ncbi:MAG: hypothetical protein SGPRY_010724 [Prymnesium sp.]
MRLYRSALKNVQNWTVHRDLFLQEGFKLRAEFDANKSLTNPQLVQKLLSEGEAKNKAMRHPSPYIRALTTRDPRVLLRSATSPPGFAKVADQA